MVYRVRREFQFQLGPELKFPFKVEVEFELELELKFAGLNFLPNVVRNSHMCPIPNPKWVSK